MPDELKRQYDALLAAAQAVINDGLDVAEERVHPCDINNDEAKAQLMPAPLQALYYAVNAIRRTTPATPAGDEGLPPLPRPHAHGDIPKPWAYFTADQYRQGQREAIEFDRAHRAGSTTGDAEITNEMADAGAAVLYGYPRAKAVEWVKEDKFESCAYQARETFLAMLAAAPSPQPPAGEKASSK